MNKKSWIFNVIMTSLLLCSTQAQADKYIGIWTAATNPDSSDLGSGSGFGLLVGYQFNENFAVEGGKRDFGSFSGSNNSEIKISSNEIAVVGILPLSDTFSAYARIGGFDWTARVNGSALKIKDDDDGVDIVYSAGFLINASDQGMVKFEYSEYNAANINIGYVGMGFEIHF